MWRDYQKIDEAWFTSALISSLSSTIWKRILLFSPKVEYRLDPVGIKSFFPSQKIREKTGQQESAAIGAWVETAQVFARAPDVGDLVSF